MGEGPHSRFGHRFDLVRRTTVAPDSFFGRVFVRQFHDLSVTRPDISMRKAELALRHFSILLDQLARVRELSPPLSLSNVCHQLIEAPAFERSGCSLKLCCGFPPQRATRMLVPGLRRINGDEGREERASLVGSLQPSRSPNVGLHGLLISKY